MINLFTDLQERIAGRLMAEDYLAANPAVKVSTEKDGDVGSAIDRGLKGNGLALVVMTPRVARRENLKDGLAVTVLVGVAENPMVNRGPTGTRKSANDVALVVMSALWDWTPSGAWAPLDFVDRTTDESTVDLVAYAVRFETWICVEPTQETETATRAVIS